MSEDAIRVGDVVFTELTASFDRDERKRRRTVLVKLDGSGNCVVVAISTKLHLGDQDWHVRIPHSNTAASPCCTSLTLPSVAKVYWYEKKAESDCVWSGALPVKTLAELQDRLRKFNETLIAFADRKKQIEFRDRCADGRPRDDN